MLPIFKHTSVLNKNLTEYVYISAESSNNKPDRKISTRSLDASLFNEIFQKFSISQK